MHEADGPTVSYETSIASSKGMREAFPARTATTRGDSVKSQRSRNKGGGLVKQEAGAAGVFVKVQALAVWNAGALDVNAYVAAVEARKQLQESHSGGTA